MVRFVALIILFSGGTNLFAQQCGYDGYYLFAVNPHFSNSDAETANLKMYLVDEKDQPIRVAVTYEDNKQWYTRSDTLFFWLNEKIEQSGRPLCRRKYYNIGRYYVVAFHLDMMALKDPLQFPVYKLKIEGGYNKVTKESYPARLFHLQVQKAVRICNNGVLEDDKPVVPVKTIDNNVFEPIQIVLGQPAGDEAAVVDEKAGLRYAVRFDYAPVSVHSEEINEYTVSTARIYNTANGRLHQEIDILSNSKTTQKGGTEVIRFADYYNRGITEAQDFSVQMDRWRDLKLMVYREKTNYYIFNTSTKKYELDTALSNYDDVFYYRPLKKMRRYDYVISPRSKTSLTYQLENRQWVLIDKAENVFDQVAPPIKYSPKACILYKDQSHTLPLQAVTGTNATRIIADTFWLYNACDDAVYITGVESPTRDFFSISKILLPKQSTPLVFKGVLQNSGYDFTTLNFSCNLTLADNTKLFFGLTVPVVSNNISVVYNKDSTINHAIAKHENQRYTYAILTYPNGNLRAKGLVLDGDTSLKAGTWRYFYDGYWGIDVVVYSKAVHMSAIDENNGGADLNFKIRVLENGIWRQPITDMNGNAQRIFITDETDSILAYTDSSGYTFALAYKQMPEEVSKQFYLLKPGQRSLKIGYYTVPFNIIKDSYTLIPEYSVLKSNTQTTYQLTDSMIRAIQQKYPGLGQVYVSRSQRGIDLSGLNEKEKSQLLAQLTQDKRIAFISQLCSITNNQRILYCNNLVYVETDNDRLKEIKEVASELGFVDVKADMGINRYMMTYKSKMIDAAFFESYKKLTENHFVVGAFLNTYAEPEPEFEFKTKW